MVQANPDAKVTGRRGRRPEERTPLMESCSDHSLCNGENGGRGGSQGASVLTRVTSSPLVSALFLHWGDWLTGEIPYSQVTVEAGLSLLQT